MIKKITKTDWFKSPLIPAPARADKVNEIIDEINGTMTLVDVNVAGDLTVAGTTTLNGDLVLGDSAADSLAINAKTTYTDVINYSNQTDITAFAPGGQASATALTEEVNNITTCATEGDSVKLSAAEAGKHIYVKNSGATALDIFPATADSINALAVNLAIRIQPGSSMHFYAKDAIVWESANDTSITIPAPSTLSGGLELKAANSAGNTITTITNASMAAARTLTIPDPGAAASFVMTEGAQTINGVKTLGSGLTGIAGAAGTPSFNFVGDLTTGLFSGGAGILGFSTSGVAKWLLSGGDFVPQASNYDIGSPTLPVSREFVSLGRYLIGAVYGTAGAATVTVTHFGDGKDITTVLTLTNFIVGAIPAANAALAIGNIVFAFPAGAHVESVYSGSLSLTLPGDANAASVVGFGSVIGSGAVAVLNATATFMDRSTEVTTPTASGGGAITKSLAKVTAGAYTGIGLNVAASVKNIFLNAAGTWVTNNAGNLTATGTITFKWTIM